MKSIKIACSGFPVGQKKYRARLSSVELSQMFEGLPQAATLERWRTESGDKFEFIACAPEDVTHMQAENSPRRDRLQPALGQAGPARPGPLLPARGRREDRRNPFLHR